VLVRRNDSQANARVCCGWPAVVQSVRYLRGLRLLTESRAGYEDGPLLLEAEGTGPAACDICGDALEASGSMKCRSAASN
jgi:hypothetical protein